MADTRSPSLAKKRPAEDSYATSGPGPTNKRQKAQAGPPPGSRRRVQFKSGAADVQPDDDGRLFASPPFPISAASLRLQQATCTAHKRAIQKGDLDLLYIKSFVKAGSSRSLFTWCAQELPWYKVQYRARNMEVNTPRYTTTFGCDATYGPTSNILLYEKPPRQIPAPLQELLEVVQAATGAEYNFLLMNYYEDGQHSISFHSDDEQFLGPLPCIASLSLGGSRDFLLKHKQDAQRKEKYLLESGDLIVMRGTTQSKWLHSIPKRQSSVQPRINITFRKAMNAAGTNNYHRYNIGTGPVFRLGKAGKMEPASL